MRIAGATLAVVLGSLGGSAVGGSLASATTHCPDADLAPAPDNLARVEAAMLCLMNEQRSAAGLVALERVRPLDRSASFHSNEMVGLHFFGHGRPGHPPLLARIRRFRYFDGVTKGLYTENVGVGAMENGSARALVDAWMASRSHRANLLYPHFRDVGVAGVLAPPDPAFFADFPSTVYTTDFGRRLGRVRCRALRRRSRSGRPPSTAPRGRYCSRRGSRR